MKILLYNIIIHVDAVCQRGVILSIMLFNAARRGWAVNVNGYKTFIFGREKVGYWKSRIF